MHGQTRLILRYTVLPYNNEHAHTGHLHLTILLLCATTRRAFSRYLCSLLCANPLHSLVVRLTTSSGAILSGSRIKLNPKRMNSYIVRVNERRKPMRKMWDVVSQLWSESCIVGYRHHLPIHHSVHHYVIKLMINFCMHIRRCSPWCISRSRNHLKMMGHCKTIKSASLTG